MRSRTTHACIFGLVASCAVVAAVAVHVRGRGDFVEFLQLALLIILLSGALPAILAAFRNLRRPAFLLAIWIALLACVSTGILYLAWFEAGMTEAVGREMAVTVGAGKAVEVPTGD